MRSGAPDFTRKYGVVFPIFKVFGDYDTAFI